MGLKLVRFPFISQERPPSKLFIKYLLRILRRRIIIWYLLLPTKIGFCWSFISSNLAGKMATFGFFFCRVWNAFYHGTLDDIFHTRLWCISPRCVAKIFNYYLESLTVFKGQKASWNLNRKSHLSSEVVTIFQCFNAVY